MSTHYKKILVVLDCCIGCHACEIACRQENDLTHETDSQWCRVITIKPRRVYGDFHLDFYPTMCLHCDNPFCAECCPAGAIIKREDGIVVVDEKKCDECKLCVYACPYGAMHYNEVTKTVGKCNLCLERIEYGIEPSCVQHCLGGALRYVTPDDLAEITKGKHTVSMGKICYASSKWKLTPYQQARIEVVHHDR